jgi:hypothetical protein
MRGRAPLLVASLCLACGTVGAPPVIIERSSGPVQPAMSHLALAPFSPDPALGPEVAEAVGLVERFVAEELGRLGVDVIPVQDVRSAVERQGGGPARALDRATVSRVVVRDFAATGLLVGRVMRYRTRSGQGMGSTNPASVAFELVLYGLPDGRRLWSGVFDETQIPLSDGPGRARRYPGGGTRWLDAGELARWGAAQAAEALDRAP